MKIRRKHISLTFTHFCFICREFWKGIRCEQLDYVTFWKTVAKADKFAQIFFVGTVILTAMILSLWCYRRQQFFNTHEFGYQLKHNINYLKNCLI